MSDIQPMPEMTKFEAARHFDENAREYWTARELQVLFSYRSWDKFDKVIDEAIAVCANEGQGAVEKNFSQVEKVSGKRGPAQKDYHLTRHACYLIAMSADGTKLEVALAKIYFAVVVEQMELISQFEEELLRLEARPELTDQDKKLATLARKCGIITDLEFAAFWNAGYLGLYHEMAHQIRARKGITERQLIGDHSGSTEIGYNIFKDTLARELMRARGVKTKTDAIATHFEAGERVRRTIEEAGLATPEFLATPAKSYQQLLKEQKVRLRLKLEDALGLWAQLLEAGKSRKSEHE